MSELPKTLEAAVEQAKRATQTALAAGLTRLQVELVFPELKHMPIAEQFLDLFADYGANLKVYFPDAGAAALARRDWGPMAFEIRGIGEIRGQIQPEDRLFFLVNPSAVEVNEVEKLSERAGDRPLIMLNPDLESVATIGIGYAARQLRDRLLSTFEPCYYLRPLDQAAILRCYPGLWQVWLEKSDGEYDLISETPQRPMGDDLDQILLKATANDSSPAARPASRSIFTGLQRFLKALGQ